MSPRKRLRFAFPWRSRDQIARDLDTELAFHQEMRVAELVAAGQSPDDAARQAHEEFGDIEFTRRYCRDVDQRTERTLRAADQWAGWLQDIRYAVRTLRRTPGFTVIAVLTLALAIGANTAIFSVARAVLLKPLPFGDPGALVALGGHPAAQPAQFYQFSAPDLMDYRTRQRSFTGLAAFVWRSATLQPPHGDPEILRGLTVTANMFELLRTPALYGRTFIAGDDAPGAPATTVLSDSLWQRAFGGDPGVIGKSAVLSNQRYTIIGVMPAGFSLSGNEEIWVASDLSDELSRPAVTRNQHIYNVIGRLKPGVLLSGARADVRAISGQLAREYPAADGSWVADVKGLRDAMTARFQQPVLLLLGAAALVLLIACANLANLNLSRTINRRPEFAVRAALGAGRLRLARQLLTESLILSIAGGLLGLAIAVVATRALLAVNPQTLPAMFTIGFDGHVLFFSLAIAVATGVAFGVAPARNATRADLHGSLKEKGRGGSAGRAGTGLRRGLVVAQVGLAVVLLVGAGLLIRSFAALTQSPLGFRPDHVMTAQVRVDGSRYDSTAVVNRFYDGVLEQIRRAPGIVSVGAMMQLPTQGRQGSGIVIEGTSDPGSHDIGYTMIRGDAFDALHIPTVAGRGYDASDSPDAPGTVIVNQAAARAYFPDGKAIGHRVRIGPNAQSPWATVIGVVADIRDAALDTPPAPMVYDNGRRQTWWTTLTLVVRTTGEPTTAVGVIRQAVHAGDPTAALREVRTMDEVVGASVSARRFILGLAASFAGLALLLAAVGIYGVLAFLVTSRTREFGVRLALGASTRSVLFLVIRQGLAWSVVGAMLGVVAAVAGSKLLSGLLYGIGPVDLPTYGAVLAGVVAVVTAACAVPAFRAMRVDPVTSMRAE